MTSTLRFSLSLLPMLLTCSCAFAGVGANSVVNMSHYDEMQPHFGRMVNEGIVGVIHEATYPIGTADAKYGARQDQTLAAGLHWGAYHFGDATDPVRQADRFLEVVSSNWRKSPFAGRSPGVLLVLDFEQNTHYRGGTMRVDQAAAFAERIKSRTGRYPGLYASESRIKEIINSSRVNESIKRTLSKCWLWVANYHYVPKSTAPWDKWDMWQYTGDGICDLPRSGFPISIANIKKAERNMFNGSKGDTRAFWERNAWNPGSSGPAADAELAVNTKPAR